VTRTWTLTKHYIILIITSKEKKNYQSIL